MGESLLFQVPFLLAGSDEIASFWWCLPCSEPSPLSPQPGYFFPVKYNHLLMKKKYSHESGTFALDSVTNLRTQPATNIWQAKSTKLFFSKHYAAGKSKQIWLICSGYMYITMKNIYTRQTTGSDLTLTILTHRASKKSYFLHFFSCWSGQLTHSFFHRIVSESCVFDTKRCSKQFWTQFNRFVVKFDKKNANARSPKSGIGKIIFDENQYTFHCTYLSLDLKCDLKTDNMT